MADFTDKLLCAIGAHDWTKWEQRHWVGRISYLGKTYDASELRQKRTCRICGKMQDEVVSNG